MDLRWRPKRVIWPVRFSHGADGYLRGCEGSIRDVSIPAKSGWFEVVMYCDHGLAFLSEAYRPLSDEERAALKQGEE